MSHRASVACVALACMAISTLGCKKLFKAAKNDEAADSGVVVASTPPSQTPAASAEPPEPVAPPSPADDTFTAPGACVNPQADMEGRTVARMPPVIQKPDLDGDGKVDRLLHLDLGEVPGPTFVYVMRGTCGHFVGRFDSNAIKLPNLKSKGLKSLDVVESNVECTDDCKKPCSDKAITYFFNGKTYQAGKPKSVLRKCDAKAAASASASATPSASASGKAAITGKFKPGQHLFTIATKGVSHEVVVVGYTAPKKLTARFVDSKDTDSFDEDDLFTTRQ